MADTITWGLNGVVLPADARTSPAFATDVSTWRTAGLNPVRRPLIIPGQHGTLEYGLPVSDEPKVNVTARFSQDTMENLNKIVGRWNGLLFSPTLTLTRTVGTTVTTAVARLDSHSQDSFTKINGLWTSRVIALFGIPGAFFRQPVAASADIAFNADLSLTEIASLSGSTTPIPDAIVRVTGPATSVAVTDPTTGTGISWSGALTAGQYLFLNPVTLRARISALSTDWVTGGTDATAGLSYPFAGPLQLWPIIVGFNDADVKVRFSATRAGSTAATKIAFYAGRSFDA